MKVGNKDNDSTLTNELASRKEVGSQDNLCTSVPQPKKRQGGETINSKLERLVGAVDSVTGKLGGIESRLNTLEAEIRNKAELQESLLRPCSADEPLFHNTRGA